MTAYFQSVFGAGWGWFLANLLLILLIALPLMLAVAMIIYADRKIWAAMALRRGPNVVGPFGLLQSFADGLKVFLKETIIPSSANRGLFLIAPIITFTVALVAWAVIPFGEGMVLADINVGLLYLLAVSSLGVYGIIIAGWASNSKYPFYSALRAAAQMVSYEVSIGFVLIPVVLWAGTFNLSGIVEAQRGHIFGLVNGFGFNPLLFPLAVIFLISAMAETARAPFDLTEAESELVAGYQTEYSSMSFALFWLGEYGNVLLMCGMNAVLFWGGWLPPIDWAPLYYVPGIFWFFIKILFFFFVFSWVKATVPRYRYDQLMRLGWKIFLPISLIWVFLVSGYLMLVRDRGEPNAPVATSASSSPQSETLLFVYNCRLRVDDRSELPFSVRELRFLESDVPTRWTVRFQDHLDRAEARYVEAELPSPGTTLLHWSDREGGRFRAEIAWSTSFGASGAVATVQVVNRGTGRSFTGPCPASESQV